MNNFEISFYKVIHNKYLFNKIINYIFIINNEIEFKNQKKYYVGNRRKFSIIKSLEWIIEKGQWQLLICKLNAKEYIHISDKSVSFLVEKCQDESILKLLYEKEKSKLDLVDLINLSIKFNNYQMFKVIFEGSINERTQFSSSEDLLESLSESNNIQLIQLLFNNTDIQVLESIKHLNLLDKAVKNLKIRDQVIEFIINNNLTTFYSKAISMSDYSRIKDCQLKLKLLKLHSIKPSLNGFGSSYLIHVNIDQLEIQDLLINLKIIYKLLDLKNQIKLNIKQIERIDNQDDQKKQLIKLIIKSSLQKELYKQYILKYNEFIEFNTIQNEKDYGDIIKLYSQLIFSPTGLIKTLDNDYYKLNAIQRDISYIVPKDESTLLNYYKVLFSSNDNLIKISNWSNGLKYLLENYQNLNVLSLILNNNNNDISVLKKLFDINYLIKITDIKKFHFYVNIFKNEILAFSGTINSLSIQINNDQEMIQDYEIIEKLNLNNYKINLFNNNQLFESLIDLNESKIQHQINNSSFSLLVGFMNYFKNQNLKIKLFNNQVLFKLDIDCNKVKCIIEFLLNNQIIKTLINNTMQQDNSGDGIDTLFNYLYKKLLQSNNLNLKTLYFIRDIFKLNKINCQDDTFNSIYYLDLKSSKISYYLNSISTYLTYQTIFYNEMSNFEVIYRGLNIQDNHSNIISQLFNHNVFNFDKIFSSNTNQLINQLLFTEFTNQINNIKNNQISNSFLIIQQILHFLLIIQDQDLLFKLLFENYKTLTTNINISSLINDLLISSLEFIDAYHFLSLAQFLASSGYDLKLLVTASILNSRCDCLRLLFNYFSNDLKLKMGSSGNGIKSAENEFYYLIGNNHLDILEFILKNYPSYLQVTNKIIKDCYDCGYIDSYIQLIKYKYNTSTFNEINNNNTINKKNRIKYYIK